MTKTAHPPATIAVDAMGGDQAPVEIVRGVAQLSLDAPHVQTLLVGDEPMLTELLAKYSNLDSPEVIARIMEQVRDWTGVSELQDDMTMVVIRRL